MGRLVFENQTTHEKITINPLQWDNFAQALQYDSPNNVTYEGNVYTYYRGRLNSSAVAPDLSVVWNSAMAASSDYWNAGAFHWQITITGTSLQISDAKMGSNTININIAASVSGGATGCSFIAFRSNYKNQDSLIITCSFRADPNNIAYAEFIALPYTMIEAAQAEINPYDPGGQEYPDGTPDGGYGSGTANKGDATAGTVPTHPIVSGRGVHYMLVNDAQLADFSDHMWGRGTGVFETLWQKWENYKFNPMAGVLTCHALPTAFYPTVAGAASSISIAGTSVPVSCTAVSIGIVEQVYTESLADILQYGSFLDFDYLQIFAHIPFCGICEIPPSACIGGSVKFIYRCDILTGNVACWVCTVDRFGATHQINCLTGNCAYIVPITGNDNGMSAIIGALSSNLTAMVGSFEKGAQAFATGGSPGAGGVSAAGSTANALRMVTAQKHTTVAGNVSGSVAILSNMHLFLDITYANPSYPSTMLDVRGTPSDRGGSVGTFAGTYTEFSDVHADGIPGATEEEKRMIETALKQGVYV